MTDTKTVALYVDGQHLWFAAREYGVTRGLPRARLDYEALLNFVLRYCRRTFAPGVEVTFSQRRVYMASKNTAKGFARALDNFGYELQHHILRGDNDSFDWDTKIVVDILNDSELHPPPDLIILVSGDGDFSPLVPQFKSTLVVMGFPGSTSQKFPSVVHLGEEVLYNA